jgi:hypothetical protein
METTENKIETNMFWNSQVVKKISVSVVILCTEFSEKPFWRNNERRWVQTPEDIESNDDSEDYSDTLYASFRTVEEAQAWLTDIVQQVFLLWDAQKKEKKIFQALPESSKKQIIIFI